MKNKSVILLLSSFLLAFLWSCEKKESRVIFEGGTAPVLSASSTAPMVLKEPDKDKQAIRFNWTNPNYEFNTGTSSQDVTYTLQADSAGKNFSSAGKQELVIAKNLGVTLTVKELNTILTKMGLPEDKAQGVEFRVKSSLAGSSVPLYSNVLKLVITPYLDVAVPLPPTDKLFITGDAVTSGWTENPPAAQQATPVAGSFTSTGRPTVYTITRDFVPGKMYKFLSTLGQWQPQYGGSSATGGDIGFNMGGGSDPSAIPTPADAGKYKITLNFKTGKYTVEKQ